MLVTILAVIGGLFVAWWVLSLLVGTLGDKTSIAVKNVRYQLTKHGVNPDSLRPEQIRSIAVSAVQGGQVIRNGRTKFDSYEFQKGLAYRVRVASSYLKREPQDKQFVEFAQLLLGEKTSDDLLEEMKRDQAEL